MYSPVFLSCPTTSASPPVLSISWSDHSFSVFASSFACTVAHSRPLWRSMFFSKRAFNALSSSSRCSGANCFLLVLTFFIFLLQAHRLTGATYRRKSGHSHRIGSDRRQSLRPRPVEKKPDRPVFVHKGRAVAGKELSRRHAINRLRSLWILELRIEFSSALWREIEN